MLHTVFSLGDAGGDTSNSRFPRTRRDVPGASPPADLPRAASMSSLCVEVPSGDDRQLGSPTASMQVDNTNFLGAASKVRKPMSSGQLVHVSIPETKPETTRLPERMTWSPTMPTLPGCSSITVECCHALPIAACPACSSLEGELGACSRSTDRTTRSALAASAAVSSASYSRNSSLRSTVQSVNSGRYSAASTMLPGCGDSNRSTCSGTPNAQRHSSGGDLAWTSTPITIPESPTHTMTTECITTATTPPPRKAPPAAVAAAGASVHAHAQEPRLAMLPSHTSPRKGGGEAGMLPRRAQSLGGCGRVAPASPNRAGRAAVAGRRAHNPERTTGQSGAWASPGGRGYDVRPSPPASKPRPVSDRTNAAPRALYGSRSIEAVTSCQSSPACNARAVTLGDRSSAQLLSRMERASSVLDLLLGILPGDAASSHSAPRLSRPRRTHTSSLVTAPGSACASPTAAGSPGGGGGGSSSSMTLPSRLRAHGGDGGGASAALGIPQERDRERSHELAALRKQLELYRRENLSLKTALQQDNSLQHELNKLRSQLWDAQQQLLQAQQDQEWRNSRNSRNSATSTSLRASNAGAAAGAVAGGSSTGRAFHALRTAATNTSPTATPTADASPAPANQRDSGCKPWASLLRCLSPFLA